jgi:hypothetical protein
MLIKDSTLQQLELFPLPAEQLILPFLFMAFPPSRYLPSQAPRIPFPMPSVFNFSDKSDFTDKYNFSDNVCQEVFRACAQISLTYFLGFVPLMLVGVEEPLIAGRGKGRNPWKKSAQPPLTLRLRSGLWRDRGRKRRWGSWPECGR